MGFLDKFKKKQSRENMFIELLSDALHDANEKSNELGPIIIEGQRPNYSDYGRKSSNPICISSLTETEFYLSRLCTKDGQKFTWSTYTSVRASVRGIKDVGEDKYTIFLDGVPYADLYFCIFHGTRAKFPPAGLYFSDDDTNWDIEREAFAKGLTAEQLIEIKKLESENNKLLQKIKDEQQQDARNHTNWIEAGTQSIRQKYASFNFEAEKLNPLFAKLVDMEYDMMAAYEYIHKDELFTKARSSEGLFDSSKYTVDYYYNALLQLEKDNIPKLEEVQEISKAEVERDATRLGIDADELLQIRVMEHENANLKRNLLIDDLKRYAAQAVETKKKFHQFDLLKEWTNKPFKSMVKSIEMSTAYEILHFSQYYEPKGTLAKENHIDSNILYCRKCGSKIPIDSVFCYKCGTKVKNIEYGK